MRNATRFDGPIAADYACFIRDNGAGFAMSYAEKLFHFPGTGIGLATHQRIAKWEATFENYFNRYSCRNMTLA